MYFLILEMFDFIKSFLQSSILDRKLWRLIKSYLTKCYHEGHNSLGVSVFALHLHG